MGRATHSPSGMLCRPMATARTPPTLGSLTPATKVANPSGKLWRAMAKAVPSPVRRSLLRLAASDAAASAARVAPATPPLADASRSPSSFHESLNPSLFPGGAPLSPGARHVLVSQQLASVSSSSDEAMAGDSMVMVPGAGSLAIFRGGEEGQQGPERSIPSTVSSISSSFPLRPTPFDGPALLSSLSSSALCCHSLSSATGSEMQPMQWGVKISSSAISLQSMSLQEWWRW
mmetsp:Transcript_28598/g.84233  ORF Transcript_28598/g.84233 Transcript_28598/m.84233 type:complete len:232 (-) Transcript_28598:770-1465(-)